MVQGIKITSIKEIKKPKYVYNLHVKDNHNYFAEGINIKNCHTATANTLKSILTLCGGAEFRIGTTGTIDDLQAHKLLLEGLFGVVYQAATTMELIDKGILSPFQIECVVLKHSKETCINVPRDPENKTKDYFNELVYLVENDKRNRFIKNLAMSLKKNTLILYQLVERHGVKLKELLDSANKDGKKTIHLIHGGIDKDIREEIRAIAERENNAIIIASFRTWSIGSNIKNLHNIIFASPSKAKIQTLQSIGRELRLHPSKEMAYLFDIADDLRISLDKSEEMNYTLRHFKRRLEIYNNEGFTIKTYKVDMK